MSGLPQQPVRALIADDEPLARQTLRLLLAAEPGVEIVGECGNGRDAIAMIRELQPDLLFLDIRMPEANGFEVLEAAGVRAPAVVFVTAFDEYAVDAFRAEALDYLLKPFDDLRFHQVMRRVRERLAEREWSLVGRRLAAVLESRAPAAAETPAPSSPRIAIRSGGRLLIIPEEEIDWVQAADNYVELHVGKKTYLLRQTMQEFAERLNAAAFVRVHRSAVVNVSRIRELRMDSHGDAAVTLADGTSVRVSRSRRDALEKLILQGK